MDFNVTGILWFLDNIWPMILSQDPAIRLIIGGTVCEKIPTNKYTNVTLSGRVDSLDVFYQQGDVVINPVFQGTGLKIKTFEALSYGKVTIVHPHSSQGIYHRDEAPIIIANRPTDWVNIITDIFKNGHKTSELKQKDEKYIQEMNSYICSQYECFLAQSSDCAVSC